MYSEEYLKGIQKDIMDCFSGDGGERVLEFLGFMCGQFTTTIDPESQIQSNVNEGKRQVYLTLNTFLENKPDNLVKLYEELGVEPETNFEETHNGGK